MIEIRHIDGHVLATVDYDHRGLIGLEGRDLRGANLRGVTLAHERVPIGCHLDVNGKHAPGIVGWRLAGADLSGADLRDADLSLATFHMTILTGAQLGGARVNWCAHDLTSEILRQAAKTPEQLEVAEINVAHRDWNYQQFCELNHPQWPWVMSTLRAFVRPDDIDVPAHVMAYPR